MPAEPSRSELPCVLVCFTCTEQADGEPLIMPFDNYQQRGGWAASHTHATGHTRWLCLDGRPDLGLIYRRLAELREIWPIPDVTVDVDPVLRALDTLRAAVDKRRRSP